MRTTDSSLLSHGLSQAESESASSQKPLALRYRAYTVIAVHACLFSLAMFSAFLVAYNFRWTVGARTGIISGFPTSVCL